MEDRKIKRDAPEAKIKLSFSTEPNPEVIETVRKMLLTHYEETKQE